MSIKQVLFADDKFKPIIKVGYGTVTIIEHTPVPDKSGNMLRTTKITQGGNTKIVKEIIDPAGKVIVIDPEVIERIMTNTPFVPVYNAKKEHFTLDYDYKTIIIVLLILYILYTTFYKKN